MVIVRPLILEDNQQLGKAVARMLRRNFEVPCVRIAESVVEAIDVLRYDDCPVDFIISDFNVKGPLTGADLYGWIREHKPHLVERFMFFTSDDRAYEVPVPTVLKSAPTDALLQMVDTVLNDNTP